MAEYRLGVSALVSNTTGFGNVAIGNFSLFLNTTGGYNTAIHGMELNTTGSYNTAIGFTTLDSNTVGDYTPPVAIKRSTATRQAATTRRPPISKPS